MEKKIVITKRFYKNTESLYNYLLTNFNSKTAFNFLDNLEKRIDFILKHPLAGKPSGKTENIRSIILIPHNRVYYRLSKKKIELLCLFDMRKNPRKRPY